HNDRERATRDAVEIVGLRDAGKWSDPKSLTLGILVARYLAENTHARDGSLKTELYRRGCARSAKNLLDWFGASTPVVELTPDRMGPYVTARRAGEITGRPVGATAVHYEVTLHKTMMNWTPARYETRQTPRH